MSLLFKGKIQPDKFHAISEIWWWTEGVMNSHNTSIVGPCLYWWNQTTLSVHSICTRKTITSFMLWFLLQSHHIIWIPPISGQTLDFAKFYPFPNNLEYTVVANRYKIYPVAVQALLAMAPTKLNFPILESEFLPHQRPYFSSNPVLYKTGKTLILYLFSKKSSPLSPLPFLSKFHLFFLRWNKSTHQDKQYSCL